MALVEGQAAYTVREIANAHGVKPATIRKHIGHIETEYFWSLDKDWIKSGVTNQQGEMFGIFHPPVNTWFSILSRQGYLNMCELANYEIKL